MDERLKILRVLRKADPAQEPMYAEELSSIRASKLIKSGMQIVDSNRVNVDVDAITRWARRRYGESFLRYKALAAANIGEVAKFDELLEILSTPSDAKGEYFTIPESEADTLLLEMVLDVNRKFLLDAQYGLEYFLGKRIRHGSIAGHMRGPLEATGLITERPGPAAPYDVNTQWLPTLSLLGFEDHAAASAAFDAFAEHYDQLIAYARDERLHVRSKTHPDGIFDVTISPPQYHLIRSIATHNVDFDTFLTFCLNMSWALLEPSLGQARQLLSVELKDKAVHLFSELQERLRHAAVADDCLRRTTAAIQATSTEVQRQLDTMASWFDRAESKQAGHSFSLHDLVEVAIRSALKTLTNFRPTIDQQVEGALKANASVVIVLADLVFIIFDNIHGRARVGNEPDILVRCVLNPEQSSLTVTIRNPVGAAVDRAALSKTISVVQSKIAAGDIVKGAAADKGSGLLKIAALVREFDAASLGFGLTADDEFETEVTLPIRIIGEQFTLPLPEGQ